MKIEITNRAKKDLDKLTSKTRERVLKEILILPKRTTGITTVESSENEKKIRVGDWRVFFTYDFVEKIIYVIKVRHRSKAYK